MPEPAAAAEEAPEEPAAPEAAEEPKRRAGGRPRGSRNRPRDDELMEEEVEVDEAKIEVIKPKRGPGDRGWDWPAYADELIAAGLRTPIGDLGRFRGANSSMLDVLRNSSREQWERVNQALAEYERGID
jgi:hypothetical protein